MVTLLLYFKVGPSLVAPDGKESAYNAGYSSYLENAYAGDLSLVGAAKLNLFSFTVLSVELDLMEKFCA